MKAQPNANVTGFNGHFNRGLQFHQQEKFSEAVAAYNRAIKLDPDNAIAHMNLGAALRALKKYDAASVAYERALALRPDDAAILSNYGNLLVDMKCFDKAAALQARALELEPENIGYLYNAGVVPFHNNQPDKAIEFFDRVIAAEPTHQNANWNRALAFLQKGDYREGFKGYEWRLNRSDIPKNEFSQPRWDGKANKKQTLLLTTEQGFGDVIQFARFIPQIAKKVKAIIIECRPELARLMKSVQGVTDVVISGQGFPPFDIHAPLLSLPHILAITEKDIPAEVPYFHIEPVEKRLLPAQQHKLLKVGLIWSGKATPVDRSIPLDFFLPLMQQRGVSFYGFQVGPQHKDIQRLGCDAFIYDMSGSLRDFADSAAYMQHMDLIITVDSAACHLAGALGLPTWTLLLHHADWRWLQERTDSPWYPSMRLFRQQQHDDWHGCVSELINDFSNWVLMHKQRDAKSVTH